MDIFYNHLHEFQWASIAALGSILGVIITTFLSWKNNKKTLNLQKEMNKNNIRANIELKARINWIQEVRKTSADFISDCFTMIKYTPKTVLTKPEAKNITPTSVTLSFGKLETKESDKQKKSKDFYDEFENIRLSVNKSANLILLYFGPDTNGINELVQQNILNILNLMNNSEKLSSINNKTEIKWIEKFRKLMNHYLKIEWKRAIGLLSGNNLENKYNELKKTFGDKNKLNSPNSKK
ncbi:hypothetical protein [Clostridium tyrobutyricum]|uniref:hypothetical protein n=1 Tax=Clostridium tyrobutyricum TaxID=1519 RepID=UPI0018A0C868|nr:hypothetical protein [Clostridium tyrobutyricum]MBV4440506.1 hypothetical protein [Clostridium tyrobutyricum]MEA5008205.1 hypothetical protein [Clostridium tyrobutyricum]